jgi:phosphoribosylamine--glycine ligase
VKVLVVGSGGREHALAWKLAQSAALDELHAAPGNPGISGLGSCHPVRADDGEAVLALARSLDVDLVVIGPRGSSRASPTACAPAACLFGPSAAAARIEGSKSFAKEVLETAGVPTTRALPVATAPCVVKSDGLAAGKGVFVCHDEAELAFALKQVTALGGHFLIEELLEGEELSLFAICDGLNAVALGAARDYKRAGDGDTGPNTGGMGSYSPVPGVSPADVERFVDEIHRPVLRAGRGARRSPPLHRVDADADGHGSRVQLPLRRPGDAAWCRRASSTTRSPRQRGRRPAICPGRSLAPAHGRGYR